MATRPPLPPPPPVAASAEQEDQEEDDDAGGRESPARIAVPVARPEIAPPTPVVPAAAIESELDRRNELRSEQQQQQQQQPAVPSASAAEEEDAMARATASNVAASEFGAGVAEQAPAATASGGKRARIAYDYAKAEDNEIDLVEGSLIHNIDMVDEDWWMGTNEQGSATDHD